VGGRCQVDFYLLGSPALDDARLACKLALMAWERGHRVAIVVDGRERAGALDELMWSYPEGRFLPHDRDADQGAPVRILTQAPGSEGDVVINLTREPLPPPLPWSRLLEIVPHRDEEREASREKFRHYRGQGLEPRAHEIN